MEKHRDIPEKAERRRVITRRRFLFGLGTVAGGSALAGVYARQVEPHWLRVRRLTMGIHHLPAEWVGRTIAHITDLHVGRVVDEMYLRRALRSVNELRPDGVVITGDFMTWSDARSTHKAAEVISELAMPPQGIFAVLGNHDYGRNWAMTNVAEELTGLLAAQGVRVLRNEVVDRNGLQIAGIDEVWANRTDVHGTMNRVVKDRPAITLLHNPDVVDQPGWGDYRGWILSGHTHGGQVDPPFMSPPILPIRNARYARGLVDLGDGRTLYVNPGLGYMHRVRFGCRPEITLFTLTPA